MGRVQSVRHGTYLPATVTMPFAHLFRRDARSFVPEEWA